MFKRWYKDLIYHCSYCKDLIPRFFFFIDFFYKFEYCFKKEIVNGFKSQIKYIIIVDTIHLYYIIISGVVGF